MSSLIVRYGDLFLKGDNKKYFIKMANSLVTEKLSHLDVKIEFKAERIYIDTKEEKLEDVIEALDHVSGLYSYSLFEKCERDIDKISELALNAYDRNHKENETFKIECRRVYKNYELDTYEIMKRVSSYILSNRENVKVDVHNPSLSIMIEIRDDAAYVFSSSIKAMGGYPTGTGGKALLMMSGGIDSPVAAYELIKQGMTIELVHFESTPLTSIESAQKVVDLAKRICAYTRGEKVVVHFVPFKDVHEEILHKVKDDYIITIMRRCMYKIAQNIAHLRKIPALANGESLGQVASQTIESMFVINNVTNYPVLRPLLTIDKKDIIKISEKIKTFDVSIRPFEDCCTVYVPEHPVVHPHMKETLEEESKGNFDELIIEAVKNTRRVVIKKDTDLELSLLGFSVSEALDIFKSQEKEN